MAMQIKIDYNGTEYTLEYTRQTAAAIESQGFVLDRLTSSVNVMVPLLFRGAFAKHHRGLKVSKIDEIYDHIVDRNKGNESIVGALAEMYMETITTLTENKEEVEGNAATWEILK